MNKRKKFVIIVSLVWTLVMLITVTYSWVARSWTPKLEYPKMSIATTGALVITIDDSIYNEVNVNELRNISNFALKQVSSSDGINFVSANFNPILENGVPIYDDDVSGKYIETEFWLKTQYESNEDFADRKKEVFISEDSYIRYDGEEDGTRVDLAIRISIEVQNGFTYILGLGTDEEKNQSNGMYIRKAASVSSIGKNVFVDFPKDELNNDAYQPIVMYDLLYYNGELDLTGKTKSLFTIDSASAQKVTVRIWLEGCDDNCINEIAGKELSVVLKFDSREITTEETTE